MFDDVCTSVGKQPDYYCDKVSNEKDFRNASVFGKA